MRFTVSILTYTALRQAKTCIASVLKSTEPFKLILTANGNPEAAQYFQQLAVEFPNVTVVINPNNEGFIEPNRYALTLCDTEFFVILNDDTTVPPEWLTRLAEPFDRWPETAALSGPKGGCQTLLPSFHGSKGRNFEYLEGSCLCCKTETVKKHGLFDPHLKFAYGEDSDLSLRMRELGYTLHQVEFNIHHEVSATSRFVKDVRQHQMNNHGYLMRRWHHYLRVRTFGYPIIVKRGAAHGDVLLTTPIVRALHERSPLSPIYVETLVPQMFSNHPFITKADRKIPILPNAQVIDLNNAYESHPDRHIIESYALRAELENVGQQTELHLQGIDEDYAANNMADADWCAVHSGPSTWRSKEWPMDRWEALIASLRAMGYKVVLVGSSGPRLQADADLRGRTTIHQMAAAIKRAKIFVGLDSLPFHCAECVGTPAIGLFGITDPKFISTRHGGANCVCATAPSFGLRHRVKNTTSVDDGGAAMQSITVEMVLEKVRPFAPCPATS